MPDSNLKGAVILTNRGAIARLFCPALDQDAGTYTLSLLWEQWKLSVKYLTTSSGIPL